MKTLKGLLNLTRKSVRWIALIVVILLIAYGYYTLFIRNPYTTDAYVQAYWTKVAARVNGPIVKLYVKNNQAVKKGQLLFEIDPTDFQLEVKQDEGKLRAIDQTMSALRQDINIAQHLISEKDARLTYAKIELKRFKRLSKDRAVSIEKYNIAVANFQALVAERMQAVYTVKKIEQQLGTMLNNGDRQAAEAALRLARKKLSYTKVRARVNGRLSNFYNRVGDYIQAGEPLFSIVETDYWWVQANYLEFELRRIKPGQKVSVIVSMYPTREFKGEVTAIGAGISRGRNISTQNTLPIVAESINWLRLFSRFPVYIHILKPDPAFPLRVGATAVVAVHVR